MSTEIINSVMGGLPSLLALERARQFELSSISEHHHHVSALVERTIGAIGGPLLLASDAGDVVGLIDDALESGAFRQAETRLREGMRGLLEDLDPDTAALAVEDLHERIPDDEVRALMRRAWELRLATDEAYDRLRAAEGAELPDRHDLDAMLDPLAVISVAPVPIARLLLSAARGAVALFGVLYGLPDIDLGDVERVRHLARIWCGGAYDGLRALASIPPAEVPIDLVPASDRIDLDAFRAQLGPQQDRVRAMFDARRRGERVDPDVD